MSRYIACLFALLIAIVLAQGAIAADIKVMISAGFFSVYKELGPAFEKSTGHKLITTRGPSIGNSPEAIPARLARGEDADVVIMDGDGIDMLESRGLAHPGSRIPLAESFIGMVVRAGQPKPDISTIDGLRKTLLAAKSIAYSDSSSGTYLSTIGFKKLGVADDIAGKSRKVRGPPSGEPWRPSSRAGKRKSVSSRSPNWSMCRASISSARCRLTFSRRPFFAARCRRIHNNRKPRLPCCASFPLRMPRPSSRQPD